MFNGSQPDTDDLDIASDMISNICAKDSYNKAQADIKEMLEGQW